MLKELMSQHALTMAKVEAQTWQDAVRAGVSVLEKAGFVEMRYADSIFEDFSKYGPYFVIAPGIALPHSKATAGVKKIGISVLTLKEPVKFNHEYNDPVDIVITLSALDPNTHIDMMMEIAAFLSNGDNLDRLRACNTAKELAELFS